MIKGFKEFMLKGDLITVAVGLVMALATLGLVEALVSGLITPIVGAIFGEPDFGGPFFTINGSRFQYGAVINALLTFLATATAVYFLVVVPYKTYQDARGVSAKTRPCPECTSSISVAAKRCPQCTATVLPGPVG